MKTLVHLGALLLATLVVRAVPIDLGSGGGSPADATSRLNRLNDKIDAYNLTHDPDLPDAVIGGNFTTPSGSVTGTSININVTGWNYLVLKWSNTDNYWFVGGDSGILNFPSTSFNGNGQPQNLSGYSLFNPTLENQITSVPDNGASAALLGLSLLGLFGLRQKLGSVA